MQRTWAIIDNAALLHNFAKVKEQAPASFVLAMVKSNAYGHGLADIAQVLKESAGFGVACLKEAATLRQSGIKAPIVLMPGVYNHKELELVAKYQLEVVVHEPFQAKLLESISSAPLTVWLKLDTGMHRLGLAPQKVKEVYSRLANNKNIKSPIRLMTHLSDADNTAKQTTLEQIEKFNHLTSGLNNPKSIANSAGVLAWPQSLAQWVRPGIMLYGMSPLLGKLGSDHGLLPVMTLKSKIISIHDLKRGDAVGYGGIWTCPEDMRVGVVAIGYGDGYPRHAKNGTPILIHDTVCPLVGRVSMDMITVDLRNCPEAKLCDEVTLWGNGLPAEVVANYSDTIAYELTCNVSQRVDFLYQPNVSQPL